MFSEKVCIIGAGGFGREVFVCLNDVMKSNNTSILDKVVFMVDDEFYEKTEIMGVPVLKMSDFNVERFDVIVAIGDPKVRKSIVEKLPETTKYKTLIHPTATVSNWVTIGEGSIITAGTIVTCNVTIGKHAHLNLNTTLGHDCYLGDYFTTSPGTNISGNCVIGSQVYMGSNVSIRENISICDNVIIGMGGVVVKNINKSGVYVGNPVSLLQR